MIDLIIPPSNLKHARIEPLNIPQEKLDELKTILAIPKKPDMHKSFMMRQISGTCLICGKLPCKIAICRKYGATIIERYCDECIQYCDIK